ncbi:hypothetical protein WMY93_029108 [Mugilogobius chulae]|uniref:DUF659 domain-containing protein n=1 Tax=Mugilogobius chulae TaxID=88201 RepID=A0AAW0MZ89_9GOBI
MMRHLRMVHPTVLVEAENPAAAAPCAVPSSAGTMSATIAAGTSKARQKGLDESLVRMVARDLLPMSSVEDEGFRAFVRDLDPGYVLPSRKALKKMIIDLYDKTKEKTKEALKNAESVCLTTDMWSSINMDGYIGVTGHFVTPESKLATVILGVSQFQQSHTAQNIAESQKLLMEDWGIKEKVQCMVTDNAANMKLSVQLLNIRHVSCFAHTLNLIVKKAIDQTPAMNDIREKSRKVVGLFRSSCKAKEKLNEVQVLMNRPTMKLIQEVETRWNSTYDMLERLYEQREPVGAALSYLQNDVSPLTSAEYDIIHEALCLLQPFKAATTEMSEEKRVSASKVIPLYRQLQYKLSEKLRHSKLQSTMQLGNYLKEGLQTRCGHFESFRPLALATMLDPRFKTMGFGNPSKAQETEKQLILECATLMEPTTAASEPQASTSAQSTLSPSTAASDNLWELFDSKVRKCSITHSVTADATVEVKKIQNMVDPFHPAPHPPALQQTLQKPSSKDRQTMEQFISQGCYTLQFCHCTNFLLSL